MADDNSTLLPGDTATALWVAAREALGRVGAQLAPSEQRGFTLLLLLAWLVLAHPKTEALVRRLQQDYHYVQLRNRLKHRLRHTQVAHPQQRLPPCAKVVRAEEDEVPDLARSSPTLLLTEDEHDMLSRAKEAIEANGTQYIIELINNSKKSTGSAFSIISTPMSPFDYFIENDEQCVSFRIKIRPLERSSSTHLPFAVLPEGVLNVIVKLTSKGQQLRERQFQDDYRNFLHLTHSYALDDYEFPFPPYDPNLQNTRCLETQRYTVFKGPLKKYGRVEIALHEIEPIKHLFYAASDKAPRFLTWIAWEVKIIVPCKQILKLVRRQQERTAGTAQ